MMIRVLSVEDHWTVSSGLKSRFRGERCGISIESVSTIEEVLSTKPDSFDIILLDLILPGTNPRENMIKLSQQFPGKPVIIYTGEQKDFWEIEMLKLGASGFCCKDEDREILKETIIKVYKGDFDVPGRIREIENSSENPYVLWETKMNNREKELISMLAHGINLKTIAGKQGVTENAISKALMKIKKLFRVNSSDAIIYLLRKKL